MTGATRLVMTMVVRDEEELLVANLEHHLDQGVDLILVADNGSVDATPVILDRYRRGGFVDWYREPLDVWRQHVWVTRMARRAATDHGADWVLHTDADEFWFPRSHPTIRAALETVPRRTGVVVARRTNVVARREASGSWRRTCTVRRGAEVNELGWPLGPKLAHRGDPDIVVRQGNHELESTALGPSLDDGRLEIVHLPLRTREQFRSKVERLGAAYVSDPELPAGIGRRFRHWYGLLRAGDLDAEWHRLTVPEAEVEAGLADGTLIEDHRLVRVLYRWSRAGEESTPCG